LINTEVRKRTVGIALLKQLVVFLAASACLLSAVGHAQIVTDGTIGSASSIAGPNYAITADLGRRAGGNLFHSFGRFDIGTSESATFSGPADIRNVISRVTGGTRSNIDGLIRSTMPEADLYLFNPAGLVFGPNAQLDVQGSFHAATADHLDFADGGRYSAIDPMGGSFTVAAPVAFGFLEGKTPTGITIDNLSFNFAEGHGLSLVGGDLSLTSTFIEAPGGDIQLIGAGPGTSASLAVYDTAALAGSIKILGGRLLAPSSERASGTISLAAKSIDIRSGSLIPRARLRTDSDTAIDAGSITANAETMVIEHAFLTANTRSAGNAGNVTVIVGGRFLLDGNTDPSEPVTNRGRAGLDARSFRGASGKAGNVLIKAGELEMIDRGRMRATAEGNGDGGTITIEGGSLTMKTGARMETTTLRTGSVGTITVNVDELSLSTGAIINEINGVGRATGGGGRIDIVAKTIHLEKNGRIITDVLGPGNAGPISVTADHIIIDGANSDFMPFTNFADRGPYVGIGCRALAGGGNCGPIRVHARVIEMPSGGVIDSTSFGGTNRPFQGGDASTVTVTADERLVIGGGPFNTTRKGTTIHQSQIRSKISVNAIGRAGEVIINVGDLIILDAGLINNGTAGTEDGGPITITAKTISIDGEFAEDIRNAGFDFEGNIFSGIITNSALIECCDERFLNDPTIPGDAGSILMNADSIVLSRGGTIASSTGTDSNAGIVEINTGSLSLIDGGSISVATTGAGDAGELTLKVADTLSITGSGSGLFTESTAGGKGGIITVDADVIAMDGGAISAGTGGTGKGGAINILADSISADNGAVIGSETSGAGAGGNVEIKARGTILLTGGAVVSADQRSAEANTVANAGSILIEAGLLNIKNGGAVTASTDDGGGGSISITAHDVVITNDGRIGSSSTGSGFAGNIAITATEKLQVIDGEITAEALQGNGGNITITVGDLVELNRSEITTTVASNTGNGGNISIDPIFIVLVDSRIIANASAGAGGAIQLTADHILVDSQSIISASSDLGIDGTVAIDAPDTDLTGGLTTLTTDFLNAAALLAQQCAARGGQTVATLTAAGRGALPAGPDAYQHANYFIEKIDLADVALNTTHMAEVAGWLKYEHRIPKILALRCDA
jgi:filamentous hemagglutinin family protein